MPRYDGPIEGTDETRAVREGEGGITSDGTTVKVLFRVLGAGMVSTGSWWIGAPVGTAAAAGLLSIPAGIVVKITYHYIMEGIWPYQTQSDKRTYESHRPDND